jgi:glycosyltransferase involved in cell wall biosynthesis
MIAASPPGQVAADAPRPIAVFLSFSGEGGVERMVLNLAAGFVQAGHAVDLVVAKARGGHLRSLPPGVNLVRLNARHTFTSLFALAGYLRRRRPRALLAAKDRAIRTALLARRLSGVPVRLAGRLGTTVSAALEGAHPLRRGLWYLGMRAFYRHADAIVAVSEGVAEDLAAITGLGPERIRVIRNPVITPELGLQAAEALDHPWFAPGGPPVVLGIGRLTRQKDFPTLIRAFARVRRVRPARLVILGEGRDREALSGLAEAEGVAGDFALPGFQPNPYAWLGRAALFVLSSRWEGSPNALTEAMALGVPVVATDCRSGPRELLDGGRHAPLVPVGDVEALAAAMTRMLDQPADREALRAAVQDYRLETSARQYLEALGL